MKSAKILVSLMLAVMMVLGVATAFAITLEPDDTEVDRLAGATVHATVGPYDQDTHTFTLTVYDCDRYDQDDVARLKVGDSVLAGGWIYVITGTEQLDDILVFKCENGEEIYFDRAYDDDDDMIARSTFDDRIFMHVVNEVHLSVAENIILEDDSDPEGTAPLVYTGLKDLLAVQAEKEENSIGLDFYATTVTINRNLMVEKIHVAFDVAQ